ncbi:uncharacterized protein LOC127560809 [Antechinus flavipes]|uniref:uncharacterized protein LOC127560809 n=1 Tax=Antechinus flavipes TaxID=38775 RepID=UPI002236AF14|nr:uncharacterized protein LOC127560809 [Antechinus flavipes]
MLLQTTQQNANKEKENIAVIHVQGHQRRNSFAARGNHLVDEEAKWAGEEESVSTEEMMVLIPAFPPQLPPPSLTLEEKKKIQSLGAQEDKEGHWFLPDGREVLTTAGMRYVLQHLHQGNHWDVQDLCDAVLTNFVPPGLYTIVRQLVRGCLICQRTNRAVQQQVRKRGRPPGIRSFQSIQMDFTKLPCVEHLKYLLVIVDHLTSWVERPFPLPGQQLQWL